jgi:hypothetical protein
MDERIEAFLNDVLGLSFGYMPPHLWFADAILAAPSLCVVPDVGNWSTPRVMAALAGFAHERQGTACTEHNHREDVGGLLTAPLASQVRVCAWINKEVFMANLATGPSTYQPSKFNRGSNEPPVNASSSGSSHCRGFFSRGEAAAVKIGEVQPPAVGASCEVPDTL